MNWRDELRREARQLGLAWDDVQGAFVMLWETEKLKRQHANEVRQTAWFFHRAQRPRCWPFWRHGFLSRYGRRLQRSDYSTIPGHDTLWQELSWRFPEFQHDGGCEELWALLLSPYDKLPPRSEVYRRAIELLARERPGSPGERRQEAVPF